MSDSVESGMDVSAPLNSLISKMLKSTSTGMKTLLLDSSTTQSVSVTLSKTHANSAELYLIDLLGKPQQVVGGMKALIYVRPTMDNVDLICREVSRGNFGEYHLFFSNVLPQSCLEAIAKADSNQLIRQVHEFPFDYVPINPDLFTINISGSIGMSRCWGTAREMSVQSVMKREVEGLLSVFLSLKKPVHSIVASSKEPACSYLAKEVKRRVAGDDIYVFRSTRPTQLLIVSFFFPFYSFASFLRVLCFAVKLDLP